MIRLIKAGCFVVVFFLSSVSFAVELTEDSVRALLAEEASAVQRMDADGVGDTMSEDCRVVFSVDMMGQVINQSLSKTEYVASLREGWALYENYQYTLVSVDIVFKGDVAIVTGMVSESMSIEGQHFYSESQTESTVEVVDGALVYTNVTGSATMTMEVGT